MNGQNDAYSVFKFERNISDPYTKDHLVIHKFDNDFHELVQLKELEYTGKQGMFGLPIFSNTQKQ